MINTIRNTIKQTIRNTIQLRTFLNALFLVYKRRVYGDGGAISDQIITNDFYEQMPAQDSIEFAWFGEAGSVIREDGIYDTFAKGYDLSDNDNDAIQTTASLQPYISGNIAPNENLGLKNPNGDNRHITHPEISFAADEAWTITTVWNWDGETGALLAPVIYGATPSALRIATYGATNRLLYFINANSSGAAITGTLNDNSAKNKVLTIVGDNGIISVYINGVFIKSTTINTSFTTNKLLSGNGTGFDGTISAHIIRRQALTPEQILAEATFLQTIYPEVPSVQIGTQTWATSNCEMVATPQGNVITNVTEDAIWASSQTLYDNYLTANPGDTYGATKAAAMWCYYNNDPSIGSWAGKLYNWFAVSLIQQDIDLYNIANPTNHWGYHVPSEAEFTTLQTTLGGESVAGGKMKVAGFDYWNSPNTGADNSSGFSAVGVGVRDGDTGLFVAFGSANINFTSDKYRFILTNSNNTLTGGLASSLLEYGYLLRFIKD